MSPFSNAREPCSDDIRFPSRLFRHWLSLIVLSILPLATARDDTLVLTNGEKLVGTILLEDSDSITFQSHSLGQIEVLKEHIRRTKRGSPSSGPGNNEGFVPPAPAATTGPSETEPGTPDPKAEVQADEASQSDATTLPPNTEPPAPPVENPRLPWWRAGLGLGFLEAKHGADWVQLTSGEWLRGRLNGLDDFTVDFESDKLHELSIDWKDVRRVYSPQAVVSYGERQFAEGTLDLGPKSAIIHGPDSSVTIPRQDLYRIAPGLPREIDNWRTKFNFGLNGRSGNTNQTDVLTGAKIERRTTYNSLLINYSGNYSRLEGETNTNNERLNSSFDVSLTRRLFLRLPLVEYYRDPFQNISRRLTASGGVGYDIYDTLWTRWLVFAGPAYQKTHFASVQEGESDETSTPAFVLQSTYEKYLTRHVDFDLTYQGILTNEEAGRLTHHADATLSIHLTRSLDLDFSVIWDHTDNPQAGEDGIQPKQDDVQFNLSIGVEM